MSVKEESVVSSDQASRNNKTSIASTHQTLRKNKTSAGSTNYQASEKSHTPIKKPNKEKHTDKKIPKKKKKPKNVPYSPELDQRIRLPSHRPEENQNPTLKLQTSEEINKNALRWLKEIDYLEIKQQVELTEIVRCCDVTDVFFIYDKRRRHLAQAKVVGLSTAKFGCRFCCESRRGFTLMVRSFVSGDNFVCQRSFNPCVGCCPPCFLADKLRVKTFRGDEIAECQEAFRGLRPRFRILDPEDTVRYIITGPACLWSCFCCCKDIKFTITDKQTGGKVGRIYKKWGGFVKDMVADADAVVIEIDEGIPVEFKATLVCLTFLIDSMYFVDCVRKKKLAAK